jgi:hypothetical protein
MSKGTLISLDLPNIQYRYADDQEQNMFSSIEVHPEQKQYIMEVAKAHPGWSVIARYVTARRNHLHEKDADENGKYVGYARNFNIFYKGEELGEVFTDWSPRKKEVLYCVRNFRVARKRERGDTYKTKDLKKALRAVEKEFAPKSIHEVAMDSWHGAKHTAYTHTRLDMEAFAAGWRRFTEMIAPRFMDRWEELAPMLCGETNWAMWNSEDNKYRDLLALREKAKQASRVHEKHTRVVFYDGKYAVQDENDGESYRIYHNGDLPQSLKRGIGILKLVETNVYIEGIGVKTKGSEAEVFVVLPDEEASDAAPNNVS